MLLAGHISVKAWGSCSLPGPLSWYSVRGHTAFFALFRIIVVFGALSYPRYVDSGGEEITGLGPRVGLAFRPGL